MEKKQLWFLDRYNEKHIRFFFKYLLGYGALIGSIICLISAIFDKMEFPGERAYLATGSIYLMIMGIGVVSHKEWGRKLIITFPFVAIILAIMFFVPATLSWGVQNALIVALIFTFLLVLCAILYFTLGVKYYNHPNVRKYFNR